MENIKGKVKYLITVAVLLMVNVFFSFYNFQLDLTKEKRYSLDDSTQQIIVAVNKPVKVHLYLGEIYRLIIKILQQPLRSY